MKRKLLSVLLVFAMVLTMLPVTALAALTAPYDGTLIDSITVGGQEIQKTLFKKDDSASTTSDSKTVYELENPIEIKNSVLSEGLPVSVKKAEGKDSATVKYLANSEKTNASVASTSIETTLEGTVSGLSSSSNILWLAVEESGTTEVYKIEITPTYKIALEGDHITWYKDNMGETPYTEDLYMKANDDTGKEVYVKADEGYTLESAVTGLTTSTIDEGGGAEGVKKVTLKTGSLTDDNTEVSIAVKSALAELTKAKIKGQEVMVTGAAIKSDAATTVDLSDAGNYTAVNLTYAQASEATTNEKFKVEDADHSENATVSAKSVTLEAAAEQNVGSAFSGGTALDSEKTALGEGKDENTVWIVAEVTAEDTKTKQYYVFKVDIAAASADADVTSVTVNDKEANKPTTNNGNQESPEDLGTVKLDRVPDAQKSKATLVVQASPKAVVKYIVAAAAVSQTPATQLTEDPEAPGTYKAESNVDLSSNSIIVISVQSEKGEPTHYYSVTTEWDQSHDTTLSALAVDSASILDKVTPYDSYEAAKDSKQAVQIDYAESGTKSDVAVTATATAADMGAEVKFAKGDVGTVTGDDQINDSNLNNLEVKWTEGHPTSDNGEVWVKVTAEDKTVSIYHFFVEMKEPNHDNTIKSITVNGYEGTVGEKDASEHTGESYDKAIEITVNAPKATNKDYDTLKVNVTVAKTTTAHYEASDSTPSQFSSELTGSDGSLKAESIDVSSGKTLYIKVTAQDGKDLYYKITIKEADFAIAEPAKTDKAGVGEVGDKKEEVQTAVEGTSLVFSDDDTKTAVDQIVLDEATKTMTAHKDKEGSSGDSAGQDTTWGKLKQENDRASGELHYFAIPYLEIIVAEDGYTEGSEYVLNITPKYDLIATTQENTTGLQYTGGSANAVMLDQGVEIENLKNVKIDITLPTSLASQSDKVYVQHASDNFVEYTVEAGPKVTIDVPSFSLFTIQKEAPGEAMIGTTVYTTLQEAINAVTNTGTITLTSKAADGGYTDSAKLNAPVTNSDSFSFTISAGSSGVEVKDIQFNNTTSGGYIYTAANSNGTITVTREKAASTPTGGGSSSATVTTASAKNGSFTVSDKNAKAGDTVKVTPKADKGYTVDAVKVTDKNGKAVAVKDNGDGTYSFVMPAKDAQPVKVEVTFKEEAPAPITSFVDVPAGAYYEDAVAWAVEKGITTGITDTTFAPTDGCTRGHIVTFLWRAAGSPEPTSAENPFTDVNPDSFYGKAVLWAVEQGITKGTTDTTFAPNEICTRAQAVTLLYRYEKQPAAAGSSFSDVADGAYYESAVDWAVANEITNGTGNNLFSPSKDCTRAQIVTFLYRDMAE